MSVPHFARLLVVGLLAMLAFIPSSIASANAPTRELLVNTPYTDQGFCSFDVQVDPLVSKEYITTFTDKNGNIIQQIVTGTLKLSLTNLATGQSLVINASGPGRLIPLQNGTMIIAEGQTFYAGATTTLPWGLYLISGKTIITPQQTTVQGHVTDLCAALSA